MNLQTIIFGILLSLKPYQDDTKNESDKQHKDRLEMISHAIADASHESLCTAQNNNMCWKDSEESLAILLATIGWAETKYSYHVHAGKCFTNECDPVWAKWYNKKTQQEISYVSYYKARSNWQVHRSYNFVSGDEWKTMAQGITYDATKTSALVAGRILSFSKERCGNLTGAIAMYANGKTCRWKGAFNRMYVYSQLNKLAHNEQKINEFISSDWSFQAFDEH